jgi:hypothetical protein
MAAVHEKVCPNAQEQEQSEEAIAREDMGPVLGDQQECRDGKENKERHADLRAQEMRGSVAFSIFHPNLQPLSGTLPARQDHRTLSLPGRHTCERLVAEAVALEAPSYQCSLTNFTLTVPAGRSIFRSIV